MKRRQGLNISGGRSNAVEIACVLYGLPTMAQMLESFEKELKNQL